MRKGLFLLFAMLFSAITVNAAIVFSSGETVEKVLELPRIDEFKMQAEDGNWYYPKVSIMHKQLSLFWIPLIKEKKKKDNTEMPYNNEI
jgi:hypothetical protein